MSPLITSSRSVAVATVQGMFILLFCTKPRSLAEACVFSLYAFIQVLVTLTRGWVVTPDQ